jgi:penicillin-binding protein 1A
MRALRLLLRLTLGGLVLAVVAAAGAGFLVYQRFGDDLPDHRQLAAYSPPTATRVHAADGRLIAEYARERRVFVPVAAIPDRVKQAFVAAEDQNFYEHPGIDLVGIGRAVVANLERLGSNRRPEGASTITQQVAKNFLLSNDVSLERKVKEAILALRMERAYSKDRILELYLNEIFLGFRAYGVAAAALVYFDKPLDELTVAEAAFLAGLPKAPSTYDPRRRPEAARERRDYVIGRMREDGYITAAEAEAARAEPLVVRDAAAHTDVAEAPFFAEEVRRQLVDRFGEAGFYEGGLSVRTTVDPALQAQADEALRRVLAGFDRRGGYRGPWGRLEAAALAGDEQAAAAAVRERAASFELGAWRRAVVLEAGQRTATLVLEDGARAALPAEELAWARRGGGPGLARGDLVLVERVADRDGQERLALRQRPRIEGAAVAMDPHTGRVLAISGGFSFRESKFNRATQAKRQPGSAFKPFVYLAALEQGYTPASIVVDAPVAIDQGPGLPLWRPENYTDRFYGPSTLRLGLEKSRNLMTVRLAQAIGMESVLDVARRFGIADGLGTNLAASLGSNEVTVLSLTTAYAMLVNGGKRISPALVERIQDRHGRTVVRRDERACAGCQLAVWDGSPPPSLPDTREQVEDPRHAYQMVSMLEGVVERGTAEAAKVVGKPLAGKTGTTNDAKDAWFVGFSPDLVVGVWIGYDQPQSMGDRQTGASVALPVWIEIMQKALEGEPGIPFRTPPGVSLVRIDAETGELPGPDTKTVIAEAFIPGTEPFNRDDGAAEPDAGAEALGAGFAPPEPGLGAPTDAAEAPGLTPLPRRTARPPDPPPAPSTGGLY